MLGALTDYVANYEGKDFQPMNSNWGLVPPLPDRIRDKKVKAALLSDRGLAALEEALRHETPPQPWVR
jgi:methylenetetrahydrofolate--tRNA-(uracil-5-)-methyltransferase